MTTRLAFILTIVTLTTLIVKQSSGYVINSRDVYHTRNYEGCRREMEGMYGECLSNINTDGSLSDEEFAEAKSACDRAKDDGKNKCIR